MATTYPGTIDSFTNPEGTNTLDDPDHASQHSSANDAIEAIEAVIGTTAGTSVLKDFSAGEFAVRQEGGTVSPGTLTFDSPVINDATLGTPIINGGTISGAVATLAGTQTLTNKTLTSPVITSPTYQGLIDGWVSANETWTYASSTTFTVASDVTDKYQKGDKIKLTQTTVKYFYIIGVSESAGTSTVTITGGTSYTLANEAITDNYYSKVENPQGFPNWFNFTPSWTNLSVGNGTNTGQFCIQKGVLHLRTSLVFGSSTSISGNISMTMPVNASSGYLYLHPIGQASYLDDGVQIYAGIVRSGASNNKMDFSVINASETYASTTNYVSASIPMTWANQDRLASTATYVI